MRGEKKGEEMEQWEEDGGEQEGRGHGGYECDNDNGNDNDDDLRTLAELVPHTTLEYLKRMFLFQK